MLATANGLHIDETGYKKQIFVTKQEREDFDAATEITANRATAALDGDNYIQYFYEFFTKANQSDNFDTLRYFSRVGPHTYYDTYSYSVNAYKRTLTTGDPVLVGSFTFSTTLNGYYNTNSYDNFFQINVFNTTKYKRRVKFKSFADKIISRDVNSGAYFTLSGDCSDSFQFTGVSFAIRQVYSYNI